MPPEHSAADKEFIGTLTIDELTEFQEWHFIEANAMMFMRNNWINIEQLRSFRASRQHPTSPVPVKTEPDTLGSGIPPSLDSPIPRPTMNLQARNKHCITGSSNLFPAAPITRPITPTTDIEDSSEPWQPSVPVLPVTPDSFEECTGLSTAGDNYDDLSGKMQPGLANIELHSVIGGEPINDFPISDTVWLDEHIVSHVVYDGQPFRVTRSQPAVERIELLTEIPSIWPNPETRTVFIVGCGFYRTRPHGASRDSLSRGEHPGSPLVSWDCGAPTPFLTVFAYDEKFRINHKTTGEPLTLDALIKNKDNDSWSGPTGEGQNTSRVTFALGEAPVECRQSTLKYKGCHTCQFVPPELVFVNRRDLDADSRDEIIAAEQDIHGREGATSVSSVAQFLNLLKSQKCKACQAPGGFARRYPEEFATSYKE
ncbi:hypothetical protein C8F01DRAFT_1256148 [Mycena amicta]|nr:hypothetical protein C8F01DRAFT_1256148 [Mycena amicta]